MSDREERVIQVDPDGEARAELEANAGEKAKMYYNPMAIKPFWRAYHEATGVRPSDIAGAELLDEAYHKALLDANEDERYEEADC